MKLRVKLKKISLIGFIVKNIFGALHLFIAQRNVGLPQIVKKLEGNIVCKCLILYRLCNLIQHFILSTVLIISKYWCTHIMDISKKQKKIPQYILDISSVTLILNSPVSKF